MPLVSLWHSVYCWGNSGETGGVWGLHHHGAILSEKVSSKLAGKRALDLEGLLPPAGGKKSFYHFSVRGFPKATGAIAKYDTG